MFSLLKNITLIIFLNCLTILLTAQNTNAFKFKITGNNYSDETVIRLKNDGTLNFDGNYDAAKLISPNPNVPSIYTKIANGQKLSINTLPEFNKDTSITIYTNIPLSGTYNLTVTEIMALTPNYKISLSDIQSTSDFWILGDTSISFSLIAQQDSPSFTFNISTDAVHSVFNESCYNLNNGELSITNAGSTNWHASILDDSNNVITTKIATSEIINFTNLTPGNFTASITSKGIIEEINFTVAAADILIADFNFFEDTIYLSNGGITTINNTSQNAQNFIWEFGDGSTDNSIDPIHTYTNIGSYEVSLTATSNNCSEQSTKTITVLDLTTKIENFGSNNNVIIKKNNTYQIILNNNNAHKVFVHDIKGELVYKNVFMNSQHNFSLENFDSGIYIINILSENKQVIQKKIFK